jgi:trimethylamine:corrinoid methyltransferase-like protein
MRGFLEQNLTFTIEKTILGENSTMSWMELCSTTKTSETAVYFFRERILSVLM